MYQVLSPDVPLSQGDILDDCSVLTLRRGSPEEAGAEEPAIWRVRVVVLTQACDLANQKTVRILVAVVHPAADLVAAGILKAPLIRDQIRRHQVFGWYFLPAAPAPIELPESIVDLRELHTVSRFLLERLIAEGKRVCRMPTPYREHLAQHFTITYGRIGLPEPYETQP